MALSAGSNLGPYRIIEPVGRGGMASVFKAYEASLDRYVALKVLPPEFLHDPSFAERFRREAQTIARLEHPQIIPIFAYDIDAETGTPWMAMRLISGGSLSQRIKRGRLAHTECARVLKDVAEALDYAHSAGVIHRDVKPQNVLLDDAGRVYLADFGIAKMVEASAHLTQTGMITGTPQYMAPEQALGKSIDKSIDIYALGIVAYELYTGRVPFSADTPVAVLMKQASEPMPLPPVSEVREEVTRAILRATAKDPRARWASASDFARAVTQATGTATPAATTETRAMSPISEETVQDLTAATMGAERSASSPKIENTTAVYPLGSSPRSSRAPAPANRRVEGSGVGMVMGITLGMALLVGAGGYGVYRYFRPAESTIAQTPPPINSVPAVGVTPATPEPAAPAQSPTPAPALESGSTPRQTPPPAQSPSPRTADVEDAEPARGHGRLSPAERRAILRDPERRERLEAVAEARRNGKIPSPPLRPGRASEEERPAVGAPARAPHTRILLEVEASQPSTGAQISALYAQVLIDNRPFKDFVIRFSGGNSFVRWKKVENVVLENVPFSAREITLAVGTDPGVNVERMEGSTRLAIEGDETTLSVTVRFYNQFDKSVKFR